MLVIEQFDLTFPIGPRRHTGIFFTPHHQKKTTNINALHTQRTTPCLRKIK